MSVWAGFLSDAQQFLAALRWDRPAWLWLGLLPVVLSLIDWLAGKRAKSRWAKLGKPIALETQVVDRVRRPKLSRFVMSLGWMSLAIALAGPRWGEGERDGVAVGRDLALVIDLSRSMLADDCEKGQARWQAAVRAANDLIDELKSRGGHRLSITLFAARAKRLVPLTTDYDHLKSKLNELNGRFPPPEIRPDRDDAPSGTRIGAGLIAGIESFDPRFVKSRDVILFSDGDDPATDREWRLGISAARQANVPIHAVGFGDPETMSLIPLGHAVLEFPGPNDVPDVVRTKLHEEVLQTIASETRGVYLPAKRKSVDWRPFLRDAIDANSSRELDDWQLPQKPSHAAGFYLTAMVCFGASWLLRVRLG